MGECDYFCHPFKLELAGIWEVYEDYNSITISAPLFFFLDL
jgi:hypothetical protein